MPPPNIQPNSTITGPALPEPVEVHAATPMGTSAWIIRVGRRTGSPYNAVLTAERLAALEVLTAVENGGAGPGGTGGPGGGVAAGKQRVAWSGDVPPQKWTKFSNQLLAKFAVGSDLKIRVTFEATVGAAQAKAKLDEARVQLRELGLNGDVT